MAGLVVVCALVAAVDRTAAAGGIHIKYELDAPERLAESNERYYQGVLNLEHNHPIAFALDHPFYTKMFEDPAMMDRLVVRWEAHEQRFEFWHDCLWKVLDGYRAEHHGLLSTSPIPPGIPVGLVNGGGGSLSGGADVRGSNPALGSAGTPGGGIGILSVPEPSSGVLMVSGLFIAAWAIARHLRAS